MFDFSYLCIEVFSRDVRSEIKAAAVGGGLSPVPPQSPVNVRDGLLGVYPDPEPEPEMLR